MQFKGTVRKMDPLGRVVVPMEFRKELGIKPEDPLEICPMEGGILVRPYRKDAGVLGLVAETKTRLETDYPEMPDWKRIALKRKLDDFEAALTVAMKT